MRAICQGCGKDWDVDFDPVPCGRECENAEWKLVIAPDD